MKINDIYRKYKKTCRLDDRKLNILLLVLVLISCWIITIVGLDLPFKITIPFNLFEAEKINGILINLSYSYLAGCIFYFFTSYLPKRNAMNDIIAGMKVRMGTIDRIIHDLMYVLKYGNITYKCTYNEMMNDLISDEKKFIDFFKAFDWNSYSEYFALPVYREKIKYLSYIIQQHERLQKAITDFIDTYKEYLSASQLSRFEELRESFLIYHLSMSQKSVFSKEAADSTARAIFQEFKKLRDLKISIDPQLDNWSNWYDKPV